MSITKPMLAEKVELDKIKYPVLATPKLDGIRCLKVNGQAVSRKFKPIPNNFIRTWIETNFPDGVDGELIMDGGTFQETTSAVMTEDGEPRNVVYHIFDYVAPSGNVLTDLQVPYWKRMENLYGLITQIPKTARVLLPREIKTEEELLEYEQKLLSEGYEGVMLRSTHGPYKCGRSTVKEGYLLKLKRFEDAEAEVIGFEERMHNSNEAKKDALGHTERSSAKSGMVPTGMLGALIVRTKDGLEFKIGTGFTDGQRRLYWEKRESYLGSLAKYKFQPTGVKEAPRFPVFLGWRSPNDL